MINTNLPKDLANRVIDTPLTELRIVARKLGVKHPWRYRKGEIVSLILAADENRLRRAVEVTAWDRTYEARRGWVWLGGLCVALILIGLCLVLSL